MSSRGRKNKGFVDPLDLTSKNEKKKFSKDPTFDILKNEFNSKNFLSTVHKNRSNQQLLDGRQNLQNRINRGNERVYQVVSSQLSNFISTKDSIDKMNFQLQKKNFDLKTINITLSDVVNKSSELFSPVINLKNQSEKIQTVVNILNKYQQIFFLPSNITEYMKKKEYKKLVYEYVRAKYFEEKLCKFKIFKDIFMKIETNINTLRSFFFKEIEKIDHITIEEIKNKSKRRKFDKKIIPINDSISIYDYNDAIDGTDGGNDDEDDGSDDEEDVFLMGRYQRIFLSIEIERIFEYLYNLNSKVDASQVFLKHFENKILSFIDKEYKKYKEEMLRLELNPPFEDERFLKKEKDLNVKYINKICLILEICMPDYIKLCENIILKKYSKKKQEDVKNEKDLLKKIINNFSHCINYIVNEIDNTLAHQKVLNKTHHIIYKCYERLLTIPTETKEVKNKLFFHFKEYIKELKYNYINNIWKRTIDEVMHFHSIEDWIPFDETKPMTNLPKYFKNHIKHTIDYCKPLIDTKNDEKRTINTIYNSFLESLNVFCDCIHDLGFRNNKKVINESELLILVGNITFTKQIIIPDLFQYLKKLKCFDGNKNFIFNNIEKKLNFFDHLTNLIINAFIRSKTNLVVKFVEKGILLSGYNWTNSPKPKGVRNFILELFLELSLVHSDIEKIECTIKKSDLSKRIFSSLSERLAELFYEYVTNIEHICQNSAFQIDIEIDFITRCLKGYHTKLTDRLYDSLVSYLKDFTAYDPKKMRNEKLKIVNEVLKKTKFQLSCFL